MDHYAQAEENATNAKEDRSVRAVSFGNLATVLLCVCVGSACARLPQIKLEFKQRQRQREN